jgi:transcriptional regulator GlxA family with amidase domain
MSANVPLIPLAIRGARGLAAPHRARRAARGVHLHGAFTLAAAGLLDGRRATTHWEFSRELAQRYPGIRVEPDPIFVRDGPVSTSAGVTAGMDLALDLVEEDLGAEMALSVARFLVVFLRRPGGQAQFSATLARDAPERRSLRDLQAWIADNLTKRLAIPELAARAAMSPRHFARVFAQELGMTPARYVLEQRVEAARRELERTARSQDEIAERCGFGSAERLRRAFVRALGVPPALYRERFRRKRA